MTTSSSLNGAECPQLAGVRPVLELGHTVTICCIKSPVPADGAGTGRGQYGSAKRKYWKVAYGKGFRKMSRMSVLSNPLLLGFEEMERMIDRANKGVGDGYPPYNIERIHGSDGGEKLRITLAVAGFTSDQLDVKLEDNQLTIRGKQHDDDKSSDYLHRGIAARQFSRTFVLAEGIEVQSAHLSNGLLVIDLIRLEPERQVRTIKISDRKSQT